MAGAGWKGALGFAVFVLLILGVTYAIKVAPSQHAETGGTTTVTTTASTGAGAPSVVECSTVDGGVVPLDASLLLPAPPDGIVHYTWWDNEKALGSATRFNATLGLGDHTVRLEARNADGAYRSTNLSYSVVDTTAPTIKAVPNVDHISPADGRFVDVTFAIDVRDACDGAATWTLDSVTGGSGAGSVQGADLGTADNTMSLRADAGTYTITFKAADAHGNTRLGSTTVTVTA